MRGENDRERSEMVFVFCGIARKAGRRDAEMRVRMDAGGKPRK
jgi:hypothetical protein